MILSWNRVIGRKGFKHQLLDLLITHKSDITVLLETRVNLSRAQNIICSLNIRNFIEIFPESFLWVIWHLRMDSADFQLEILIQKTNSFTAILLILLDIHLA